MTEADELKARIAIVQAILSEPRLDFSSRCLAAIMALNPDERANLKGLAAAANVQVRTVHRQIWRMRDLGAVERVKGKDGYFYKWKGLP
jgi:predicted DNA-binding transcriptional regulator YafY